MNLESTAKDFTHAHSKHTTQQRSTSSTYDTQNSELTLPYKTGSTKPRRGATPPGMRPDTFDIVNSLSNAT